MECEREEIYSYEKILEMLGGTKYFSQELALYAYHKLNNDLIEADYYLKICLAEAQKINKYDRKFKTQEEIDNLNETKECINI